jgi:hypothetical protein
MTMGHTASYVLEAPPLFALGFDPASSLLAERTACASSAWPETT